MLINGRCGDAVSIHDRGLLYGDGIFETILCQAGRPVLLAGHIERLQAGCRRLRLGVQNAPTLLAEIERVAQQDDCVVKVIISRGVRARGYCFDQQDLSCTRIISRSEAPDIVYENYTQGIHLTRCRYRLARNRHLAGIKHLNRLDQVLARSEWSNEFQEGVMCDDLGNIIEGTMTNVFIEAHNQWLTPCLDGAGVKGVLRQWIMRNAHLVDKECVEKDIQLSEFASSEAMFVCNSVIGIWPVARFAGKTYQVTPAIRQMMAEINTRLTTLYFA